MVSNGLFIEWHGLLKMSKRLRKNWYWWLLGVMVLGYGVLMSYLSIRRYLAFAASYDLANADQTVWNTAYGKFFALTGSQTPVSRLQFHTDFIFILLAPFYWLWNDVRMLLVLQSVLIGLGAVPIFLLTRKVLKREYAGLALAAVYLLNPGVLWTNMYDFHGVSLAMPFLLFLFYFVYQKKWRWVGVFAILSMMTKENVGLFVAMLGLGMVLIRKNMKQGFALFLAGGIWFVLASFVLMPCFSFTDEHWVMDWYSVAKSRAVSISSVADLYSFIKGYFFNSDSLIYYGKLLEPFAFLPLLGLPWLFLVGPEVAINLLSSQGQMKSIVMHYDSVLVVGVMIGLIFGLKYLFWLIDKLFVGLKGKKEILKIGVLLLILVAVARSNYFYSPLPSTPGHWKLMYRVGEAEKEFEKVLRQIPEKDTITASSEVRNHLTHRLNAYNLPNGVDESDWVAMVDQNRLVGDYEMKDFEGGLIDRLKERDDFELVFQQDHFWLFKKKW